VSAIRVVWLLGALLPIAAACGSGDEDGTTPVPTTTPRAIDGPEGVSGVWRGEQIAEATTGTEALTTPLCLQVNEPAPVELTSFAASLYLGNEPLDVSLASIGTEGALSITAGEYSYAGTVEGDRASGIWDRSSAEFSSSGTWSLASVPDESCQ